MVYNGGPRPGLGCSIGPTLGPISKMLKLGPLGDQLYGHPLTFLSKLMGPTHEDLHNGIHLDNLCGWTKPMKGDVHLVKLKGLVVFIGYIKIHGQTSYTERLLKRRGEEYDAFFPWSHECKT